MELHYIFLILQVLALVGQVVSSNLRKYDVQQAFWYCNIVMFFLAMIALIMGN